MLSKCSSNASEFLDICKKCASNNEEESYEQQTTSTLAYSNDLYSALNINPFMTVFTILCGGIYERKSLSVLLMKILSHYVLI